MSKARVAGAGLLLLVWALVLTRVSDPTPTRARLYHALMLVCRRVAETTGTAGIRLELAYRRAMSESSLAD